MAIPFMSVSMQTFPSVKIMELPVMSVSNPCSVLARVNDSNPLRSWGTCNTSCMIAKLRCLSDNVTFTRPATSHIEVRIHTQVFQLLTLSWYSYHSCSSDT